MIGGMVEHDGHKALAVHLCKTGDNEAIAVRTHGLSSGTITEAIAELRLMGLGCRTGKPLLHAWASPSSAYSEGDWENHRAAFEQEFGLQGFPCLEVFHLKFGDGGRTAQHVHRVYLRVDADGRALRTSHSAVRQEKVSRIAEHTSGERLTSGRFNKAVVARLRDEGRHDVADGMMRAGLGEGSASKAPTPSERAMTERLHDLATDEVWRRAAAAWRRADNGAALMAALAECGLRLAVGAKVPVLVSPGGAVHPLLRSINKGAQRDSGRPVHKAALDARLKGLTLPAVGDLAPLPGFEAGAFAITNLDRLPIQTLSAEGRKAEERIGLASPRSEQPRQLTAEQAEALLDMEQAFHSAAANRAKVAREAIEAEVVQDIARRKKAQALQHRVHAEKAAWDLPGIGVVGWRDGYRAELAGLPARYGAYLRWVERLDAERRRVVLKSGITVTLAPTRAWTETQASRDAMAIMIAHARERGWTSVTVTGSSSWRHDMARALSRAGLAVADLDLFATAEAERSRMAGERLIEIWWRDRNTYASSPPQDRPAVRDALIATLDRLAAIPDIIELADAKGRQVLIADLDVYRRLRAKPKREQPPPSEPPNPSGPGR